MESTAGERRSASAMDRARRERRRARVRTRRMAAGRRPSRRPRAPVLLHPILESSRARKRWWWWRGGGAWPLGAPLLVAACAAGPASVGVGAAAFVRGLFLVSPLSSFPSRDGRRRRLRGLERERGGAGAGAGAEGGGGVLDRAVNESYPSFTPQI